MCEREISQRRKGRQGRRRHKKQTKSAKGSGADEGVEACNISGVRVQECEDRPAVRWARFQTSLLCGRRCATSGGGEHSTLGASGRKGQDINVCDSRSNPIFGRCVVGDSLGCCVQSPRSARPSSAKTIKKRNSKSNFVLRNSSRNGNHLLQKQQPPKTQQLRRPTATTGSSSSSSRHLIDLNALPFPLPLRAGPS